ncbi:MAG: hypothetical protein RBR05_01885 [Candidatus Methanomethylophilaceae archaeon]|nr:hypothetical protein [Candidatus Methanomethylophilaceae archaeon]MDY0224135.1 hypothetical protein [Candidatus Methanomethylophilaceae archaeon]
MIPLTVLIVSTCQGEMMNFFGLTDPWIWGAYVACFLCVALCCTYGWITRNKKEESEDDE